MIISWVGNITLNIAFVLYSIVYMPQLIHNQRAQHLSELSLSLHFLLYLSGFFDLLYGFSSHLPWQYKTVSIVSLMLINIQHIQLIRLFILKKYVFLARLSILLLIGECLALYSFVLCDNAAFSDSIIVILGLIARICGLLYCIPQIIKNKLTQSTQAMSVYFVYLNFFLAVLETIYSWCLDWGWPNKLAAPMNLLLMFVLLQQRKKYMSTDPSQHP